MAASMDTFLYKRDICSLNRDVLAQTRTRLLCLNDRAVWSKNSLSTGHIRFLCLLVKSRLPDPYNAASQTDILQ